MRWFTGERARERREARLERKRLRQEGRTARAAQRQESTMYMASQGMRKGQVLGDLISKGLDIASSKLPGKPGSPDAAAASATQKGLRSDVEQASNAMKALPLIVGAGVLYMVMSKKGKR